MRFLKYFTFIIFTLLCTIINSMFIPDTLGFNFGCIVGNISMVIFFAFDYYANKLDN